MNLIAKKKLMQTLGPLPLQGRSWPQPIAAMAWLFVAFIIFWVGVRAHELKEEIHAPLAISVVICLLGLCVFAYYMWFGATRITENGIEQDWLFKRFIEWDEIRMAKFVPLFFSKRLICFPHRGRPVIFHAGQRNIEVAFAHIALAYSNQRTNP